MSQSGSIGAVTISIDAYADYSTKQHYLFYVDATAGRARIVGAAGAKSVGVMMNKPSAAGMSAQIAVGGVVPCVAGGTVTQGDLITADANGKGVTATAAYTNTNDAGSTTDALIGSYVIGTALSSAASGEEFRLLIQPLGAVPTTAI